MAIITHRCTACAHPDVFHDDRDEGNTGACSYGTCTTRPHTFGPPEIIPTWVSSRPIGSAVPDPVIAKPGSAPYPMPRLCDCEDCWALYNANVGQVAA